MNKDTTIKRVILIAVISFLSVPYLIPLFYYGGDSMLDEDRIEAWQIFNEIDAVKVLTSNHFNRTGSWPESYQDLPEYVLQPKFSAISYQQPNVLIATINEDQSRTFAGSQVVYQLRVTWHCDAERTTLPAAYKPTQCGGRLQRDQFHQRDEVLLKVIAFLAIIGIVVLAVFYHPLIRQLKQNQFKLQGQRQKNLKKLAFLLQLNGHQQPVYQANQINAVSWQKILKLSAKKPRLLMRWILRHWPIAHCQKISPNTYRLHFKESFRWQVEEFFFYLANRRDDAASVQAAYQQCNPYDRPFMVWSERPGQIEALQQRRQHLPDQVLLVSQQQLTQLLIPNLVEPCLLQLMCEQLPLTSISPYQIKGGINKPSHFYGRREIIRQILSNHQSCFLLVGGRQLGKTSILKAILHQSRSEPNHHCLYLSLSDHRLLPRLSHHLKIDAYESLTDLISQYKQAHGQQRLTLLLDEADPFIQAEQQHDYQHLKAIRACAEQGLCQVVLAGFWELYADAVLDYHSPLKNLTEVIHVGALEQQAAQDLILEPMTLLKQKFEHPDLVEHIIKATGQRANLINIACDHLVKQLSVRPGLINQGMVETALQCQNMDDALQGWSALSAETMASGMDRLHIYLICIHGYSDLQLLSQTLRQADISLPAQYLTESTQRLRLAHVVTQHNNRINFAVPLFQSQFSREEATALLNNELNQLHEHQRSSQA